MRTSKRFRGRHKFVCDVDGMTYYSEDKRIRWDGAVVHKDNWEPRHPQDKIKAIKDTQQVPHVRPEKGDGSTDAEDYTFITETNAERAALL